MGGIERETGVTPLDWPMTRHDFSLTGRSAGKGDISIPKVKGEIYYTSGDSVSMWIEDINMDGLYEYIFIEGGRIKVRNQKGELLWQSEVCNPMIIGFHDLDASGAEKCVVASVNLRTLAVFSGISGEVYWQHVFEEKTVMLSHNRMKVGRINPDLKGEQITVWPEGDYFGYLFTFENGVRNGYLAWKANGIGIGERTRYRPNVLVGDIKGNGKNEIVVIEHSEIMVVDIDSGTVKHRIKGPNMRNYGYAGLFDADNDGKPELVLVNDAVQLHVSVIKFIGDRFEYLWDRYIGYGEHVMKTPYFPVCDVDGDGKLEAIYCVGDVSANRWDTEILDCATGNHKAIIHDTRILDCDDVDGDGVAELLLEKTLLSEIAVYKMQEEGPTEIFKTGSEIVSVSGEYRPLHCSHIANDRGVRYFYDADGDGNKELSIIEDEKLHILGFCQDRTVFVKGSSTLGKRHTILNAVPRAGNLGCNLLCKIKNEFQGVKEKKIGNKLQLYSFSGTLQAEFDAVMDVTPDTPVVTDIDSDGIKEIMLGDSVYFIDRHNRAENLRIRTKWRFAGDNKNGNVFFNSTRGVTFLSAWDCNGDGLKELLFRNTNAELIMTDCNGKIKWRKMLKGDFKGGTVMDCTFGKFLFHSQYDIFANVASTAAYINECMVLDSSTGEVIWRRNDGHDSGMGPVDGYAAVKSLEDDGLDDLLFLSGEVLVQIDGKTGKNLIEMKNISDILGTRWVGSGQFTLVDVDRDGQDELFLSGVWGLNGGVLKWDGQYWKPLWFDYYGNYTPIGTPPRYSHQGIAYANGRVLAAGPRSDYKYGCVDAATGELLWTYDIGDCLVGDTCTGDIDGDGVDEFIFGCNDGYVYSLKHDGTLHFRIFVGSPPGNPILADIDGDDKLEVLVTTMEGKLLVIG